MSTNFAFAYVTGSPSGETMLAVQTYEGVQTFDASGDPITPLVYEPIAFANIDTVSSSGTPSDGETINAAIFNVSVSSNLDGSFEVFWTEDSVTQLYQPGPPIVVGTDPDGNLIFGPGPPVPSGLPLFQYATYEQAYTANGQPETNPLLLAQGSGGIGPGPSDGAGNASGGFAYAYVTGSPFGETTLFVQTYDGVQTFDANGNPITPLVNNPIALVNIDTVSSSGAPSDGETIAAAISNVSVSSNLDGSFEVFWTDSSVTQFFAPGPPIPIIVGTDSDGNPIFGSEPGPPVPSGLPLFQYATYEQTYAANGQPEADKLLIAQGSGGIGPGPSDGAGAGGLFGGGGGNALKLVVDKTLIGLTASVAVPFTVTGLLLGGAAIATFKDSEGHTVQVSIVGNLTHNYTANLSTLADGTVTSSVGPPPLPGLGNPLPPVAGTTITLDRDAGEQSALALAIGNHFIGSTAATAVPFTTSGLDPEDTGTVTFTDTNGKTVQVAVTGDQSSYTANLSTLADGSITSSLAVNADAAGNAFAPVAGTTVTLDRDLGEQAALALTVGNTDIGAAAAAAVPFTIAGLDSEDTGTVTSTDTNGKTVQSAVNGGQSSYTANLASLADGTIASSLAVSTDAAGNSFAPVAGPAIMLDQDQSVAPIVSFIGSVIDAAADNAWPVTISGLDDETGTLAFTDAAGHTVSVGVTGNGIYSVNLAPLSDGAITSALSISDPAGNHWNMAEDALTLVGTALTGSNSIKLPATSTGNLGTVGTSGPTVLDAAQTDGVTFRSGNGPDTIIAGPNDTLYAGNGPDTLMGASGATLHAGNGSQTLYGAPGETMIGGSGPDTFVFEPGFGHDTVANFHTGNDVLQFNPALLANFAAAMADTKQVGADAVITLDANDSITVQNVNVSRLTASNFHFA
jgi:hypothetical protein